MKLYYIALARIPTEKAHGLTIAKSCEAFGNEGVDVTLVIPRRVNDLLDDVYTAYNLKRTFTVKFVPIIDLLRLSKSDLTFRVQAITFYISACLYMLFKSRSNTIIYTRQPLFALLSFVGFRVVYECHHVFNKSNLFFMLCHRAYKIVTISHALKHAFTEHGFDDQNILVAPSGVDLTTFEIETLQTDARRELGLPMETPLIVYTGNFTTMGADKGIADIIQSLTKIPQVIFVAVGGSAGDMQDYNTLAQKNGVETQVRLFGSAPQSKLAVYQRAADILLMPFPDTPHYRNHMSPVKMFEYMASGVPIIASDLPTIREVLNEHNAMIVAPGNSMEIAHAITELLGDANKSRTLAEQAKKDVREYSWPKRTQRILEAMK
jgi:glycosyltransferase involved in cell wall biosynthesis